MNAVNEERVNEDGQFMRVTYLALLERWRRAALSHALALRMIKTEEMFICITQRHFNLMM